MRVEYCTRYRSNISPESLLNHLNREHGGRTVARGGHEAGRCRDGESSALLFACTRLPPPVNRGHCRRVSWLTRSPLLYFILFFISHPPRPLLPQLLRKDQLRLINDQWSTDDMANEEGSPLYDADEACFFSQRVSWGKDE